MKKNYILYMLIGIVLIIIGFFAFRGNTDKYRLSENQINRILENAPRADGFRGEILETSYKLLGRVDYVWGGKGYDTDFEVLPTELDCSGFTGWVYKFSGVSDKIFASGTSFQWDETYEIEKEEMLPGDLAFLKYPHEASEADPNHVGIYLGKDSHGENLYIHCSFSKGVMIETYPNFKFYRRLKGL